MLGDSVTTRSDARSSSAAFESDDPCRIWLGGLPPRTTEFAVIQLTRQFGQLTDFRFPVHRAGENQGSTVGYCFISYASPDVARKALNALDGLNFHGHKLVVRPAHPTRDELSSVQQSEEEAAILRITEQAKLCEAKLAARLAAESDSGGTIGSTKTDSTKAVDDEPDIRAFSINLQDVQLHTSRPAPTIPDLYGRLGRVDPIRITTQCSSLGLKRGTGLRAGIKRPVEAKQAIRRIEMALQRLEQTPVGGTDLLQPLSYSSRRPVLPQGIFAHSTSGDSRGSSRNFSGSRSHPQRGDRYSRLRRNRL